jgi:UrcA family protein
MNALIKQSTAVTLIAISLIAAGRAPAADPGALASQSVENKTGIRVRYADLDLSKPEDVSILYKRISRAARDNCGADGAAWDGRTSLMEKCIGQTIEDAVNRINKPLLTALHLERMNRPSRGLKVAGTT